MNNECVRYLSHQCGSHLYYFYAVKLNILPKTIFTSSFKVQENKQEVSIHPKTLLQNTLGVLDERLGLHIYKRARQGRVNRTDQRDRIGLRSWY